MQETLHSITLSMALLKVIIHALEVVIAISICKLLLFAAVIRVLEVLQHPMT